MTGEEPHGAVLVGAQQSWQHRLPDEPGDVQAASTEVTGGHDLCTGAAPLKGWSDLQALDGLMRGSYASQHRLPSLRVIPVPHASSSPLVSEYRAPQGQGPTMLVPSSSPGDAHLVSQGGERASQLPLPPPCLFSLYYRINSMLSSTQGFLMTPKSLEVKESGY